MIDEDAVLIEWVGGAEVATDSSSLRDLEEDAILDWRSGVSQTLSLMRAKTRILESEARDNVFVAG